MTSRARSTQQGFSLYEVLLALTISTGLAIASVPYSLEVVAEERADLVVQTIFTIGTQAQRMRTVTGSWPDQTNSCAGAIAALTTGGYIAGITATSPWGSGITTSCPSVNSFVMQVTAPTLERGQYAVSEMYATAIDTATLAMTTTLPVPGGEPALDNVLHRVVIAGRPELNRMQTAIDMNGQNLNNLNTVTFTGSSVTLINGTPNHLLLSVPNNGGLHVQQSAPGQEAHLLVEGGLYAGIAPGGGSLPSATNFLYGKTTLSRDGASECCGNNATIAITENTGTTGRLASISFHSSGSAEGRLEVQNTVGNAYDLSFISGLGVRTSIRAPQGEMEARDFVSNVTGRSLSQAIATAYVVNGRGTIPKPTCPAATAPSPRIFTSLKRFGGTNGGAQVNPVYFADAHADDVGGSWDVYVYYTTAAGNFVAASGDTYNQVTALTKCE